MKGFRQFLSESEYQDNPVPTGKYTHDDWNTDHLVSKIDKHIESGKKIPTKTINPKKMVADGKLKATQHKLSSMYGGGDPVHPEVHHPSIVHHNGEYHIIDGHHRIAKAFESGEDIKVAHFK